MAIAQNIIDFVASYNSTGAALTPDQLASFTADLKTQINQISVTVPD